MCIKLTNREIEYVNFKLVGENLGRNISTQQNQKRGKIQLESMVNRKLWQVETSAITLNKEVKLSKRLQIPNSF